MNRFLWVLFGGLVACEVRDPGEVRQEGVVEPAPAAPAVGTNGVEPVEPTPTAEAPAESATGDLDQALGAFAADVDGFRASTELAHTELVAALRDLANALERLPNAQSATNQITELRANADRIQASSPTSLQHADWTKAGLQAGLGALTAIAQAEGRTLEGLDAFRARLDALPVGPPLLQERAAYADALNDMGDFVRRLAPAQPVLGTE